MLLQQFKRLEIQHPDRWGFIPNKGKVKWSWAYLAHFWAKRFHDVG
jgi:hypothetical protein